MELMFSFNNKLSLEKIKTECTVSKYCWCVLESGRITIKIAQTFEHLKTTNKII